MTTDGIGARTNNAFETIVRRGDCRCAEFYKKYSKRFRNSEMKTFDILIAAITIIEAITPQLTLAATPIQKLAGDVQNVFKTKCTECHGPDLLHPEGRFGYVLDLKRLADNPEFVIPGRPTESELWILIDRNEMPPSNSSNGGLSEEQKETVRVWIEAGAPNSAGDDDGESEFQKTVGTDIRSMRVSDHGQSGEITGIRCNVFGWLLCALALIIATHSTRSFWRKSSSP